MYVESVITNQFLETFLDIIKKMNIAIKMYCMYATSVTTGLLLGKC